MVVEWIWQKRQSNQSHSWMYNICTSNKTTIDTPSSKHHRYVHTLMHVQHREKCVDFYRLHCFDICLARLFFSFSSHCLYSTSFLSQKKQRKLFPYLKWNFFTAIRFALLRFGYLLKVLNLFCSLHSTLLFFLLVNKWSILTIRSHKLLWK